MDIFGANDLTTMTGIAENFRALALDMQVQHKEKFGCDCASKPAFIVANFIADYYSLPMDAKACRNRLADIAQAIGCCSIETILTLRKDR